MRLLFGICLTLFCCCATAADSPKEAVARRLVDLLQASDVYRGTDALCTSSFDSRAAARASFDVTPAMFGSLSPSSPAWGEVETLYRDYRAAACGKTDLAAVKEIYVQVLANRLSLPDLEVALAQARTPRGKALQGAANEASRLLMIYLVERQQHNEIRAGEVFQQGLERLKASQGQPACEGGAGTAE